MIVRELDGGLFNFLVIEKIYNRRRRIKGLEVIFISNVLKPDFFLSKFYVKKISPIFRVIRETFHKACVTIFAGVSTADV